MKAYRCLSPHAPRSATYFLLCTVAELVPGTPVDLGADRIFIVVRGRRWSPTRADIGVAVVSDAEFSEMFEYRYDDNTPPGVVDSLRRMVLDLMGTPDSFREGTPAPAETAGGARSGTPAYLH